MAMGIMPLLAAILASVSVRKRPTVIACSDHARSRECAVLVLEGAVWDRYITVMALPCQTAEVEDREAYDLGQVMSGHTAKHLLVDKIQ